MKEIIYFILILIITKSFVVKDEIYIWFPSEIGIIQNCEEDEVRVKFELKTDSRKKVAVHSFEFDTTDFTLVINGKEVSKSGTFYLNKKHPIKVEIKYRRLASKQQENFKFRTNQSGYLENVIKIKYGKHMITSESVRNGKDQILDFTESCNDSLTVHFPYGGTISGVSLYKDSASLESPYKSVSYGIGDEKNYLKFSKADIGRYYVRFGACHWGNEFWLTIK